MFWKVEEGLCGWSRREGAAGALGRSSEKPSETSGGENPLSAGRRVSAGKALHLQGAGLLLAPTATEQSPGTPTPIPHPTGEAMETSATLQIQLDTFQHIA